MKKISDRMVLKEILKIKGKKTLEKKRIKKEILDFLLENLSDFTNKAIERLLDKHNERLNAISSKRNWRTWLHVKKERYRGEMNKLKGEKRIVDNMEGMATVKKEQIEQLLIEITNINENNHGENTQLTASEHENSVMEIISNNFNTEIIIKENFRKFIEDNGYQVCGRSNESLIRSCVSSIPIVNNSINLEVDKNYIVHQPSGSQNFPDIMIFRLDQSNNLQIAYIECKQKNPKFNNNPPKMNKNCIYVCGNKMFNGFLLTTQEWQDRKNEFIKKYNLLAQEFTSDDMKIVPYRVIELNWLSGRGPQCFIDREDQNIPLIMEGFSRFL